MKFSGFPVISFLFLLGFAFFSVFYSDFNFISVNIRVYVYGKSKQNTISKGMRAVLRLRCLNVGSVFIASGYL